MFSYVSASFFKKESVGPNFSISFVSLGQTINILDPDVTRCLFFVITNFSGLFAMATRICASDWAFKNSTVEDRNIGPVDPKT